MSAWYVMAPDGSTSPGMPATGTGTQIALTAANGLRVSTVFLGLDHQFGDGPPIMFETMIFRGEDPEADDASWRDLYCERYATHAEALEGHERAVARVRVNGSAFGPMVRGSVTEAP